MFNFILAVIVIIIVSVYLGSFILFLGIISVGFFAWQEYRRENVARRKKGL